MSKPIICLDFDGVIHSYTSGWKGARTIPDPPVDGAIEFMDRALSLGYDVVIHSSRARYWGGIRGHAAVAQAGFGNALVRHFSSWARECALRSLEAACRGDD